MYMGFDHDHGNAIHEVSRYFTVFDLEGKNKVRNILLYIAFILDLVMVMGLDFKKNKNTKNNHDKSGILVVCLIFVYVSFKSSYSS